MNANNTYLIPTFLTQFKTHTQFQIQLENQWLLSSMKGAAKFAIRQCEKDLDATLMAALDPKELQRGLAFGNSSRRIQWAEGRRCLQILNKHNHSMKYFTNLSHSGTWVVAIGVNSTPEILGIGIDIEPSKKQLPENAAEFLVCETEQFLSNCKLTELDLWLVKESCFKADPQQHSGSFLDYKIIDFDLQKKCGKAIGKNGHSFLFFLSEFAEHRLAVAQCLVV